MNENQKHHAHPSPRRVQVLREDVARKIAAGEVIDRPYSVLRELLDNAIDSGADQIQVEIADGGTRLIRVSDNGSGMNSEDLSLCFQSHATSKIEHEDDLLRIQTLGFRGEALSSIAAVSKLEITSRAEDAPEGGVVIVHGGKKVSQTTKAWGKGTSIGVSDLFFNLPARKKFLKRSATEAMLCKNTLIEKALAFPHIQFEYRTEGTLRFVLPGVPPQIESNYLQRILMAYPDLGDEKLFFSVQGSGDGFSFTAVIGEPGISRGDRKMVQVYANHRRIQEFSLIQAMEYGFQGFLPGGRYPVAFLFLDADPAFVDFNIHPAKREAKFTILPEIHRRVSRSVQEILSNHAKQTLSYQQRSTSPRQDIGVTSFLDHNSTGLLQGHPHGATPADSPPNSDFPARGVQERIPNWNRPMPRSTSELYEPHPEPMSSNPAPQHESEPYRYLGQVFTLFLLVELENSLYMIDMHAVHEKILFEQFSQNPRPQRLLLPLELTELDEPISPELLQELHALGIEIETNESGTYQIISLPGGLIGKELYLAEFLGGFRGTKDDLQRSLYATMACRSAVKDGDYINDRIAHAIIQGALQLENPRCPHGRPIWFEISKDELFQLVGRT